MARHASKIVNSENTKTKYIKDEDLNQANINHIGEHEDRVQAAGEQRRARDTGDEHQEAIRNANSDLNEPDHQS